MERGHANCRRNERREAKGSINEETRFGIRTGLSRNQRDWQNLDGYRLGKAGSLHTPTNASYANCSLTSTILAIGE